MKWKLPRCSDSCSPCSDECLCSFYFSFSERSQTTSARWEGSWSDICDGVFSRLQRVLDGVWLWTKSTPSLSKVGAVSGLSQYPVTRFAVHPDMSGAGCHLRQDMRGSGGQDSSLAIPALPLESPLGISNGPRSDCLDYWILHRCLHSVDGLQF